MNLPRIPWAWSCVLNDADLGSTVRAIFDAAEAGHVTVYVPAMVFAEILYLSEKRKIDMSLSDVAEHLAQHPKYQAYPMNVAVVQTAAQIEAYPIVKTKKSDN